MNEQTTQVRNYLSARGRVIRYRPATGIPAAERFHQIERLLNETWQLAATLGIDLGRLPTIIHTGAPMSPPSAILGRLTSTLTELLATYHMTGLTPALSKGLLSYTSNPPSNGTPNFNRILTDTFADDDDAQNDLIH